MILKLFSNKKLWKEIINREGFGVESEIGSSTAWKDVFNRTPTIKEWMKRREVMLLKSSTLSDKPQDFILGQIAENRLWQHYDVPGNKTPKVEVVIEETKLPNKEKFLNGWGKKDATN